MDAQNGYRGMDIFWFEIFEKSKYNFQGMEDIIGLITNNK